MYKWLPVRQISGEFRKLYKLPHWIKEKDLDFVVDRLAKDLDTTSSARDFVRYLAAPTAYGKTSLILPAFLRSTKRKSYLIGFSHYIYIAFDNNDSRTFRLSSELNNKMAKKQGGAFIVKCVEAILINKKGGEFYINVGMDDKTLEEYSPKEKLKELISKLSSGDRKANILFHVDEHRKMCPRTNEENDPGALFSKGAMETLLIVVLLLLLMLINLIL